MDHHLVCMPSNHFILFVAAGFAIIMWALYQVNLQTNQIKELTTLNDNRENDYLDRYERNQRSENQKSDDINHNQSGDINKKLDTLIMASQKNTYNHTQENVQRNLYVPSVFDLGLPILPPRNGPTYNDYQLIGYAYKNDKPNEMFQLYGRRIYQNNNKYEYYVIHPYTQIVIPVKVKNDQELNTDDNIYIKGFPGYFNVEIYNDDRNFYVPF